MDYIIPLTEKVGERIPVVKKAVPPLKKWRAYIRAEDVDCAAESRIALPEGATAVDRIAHIWLTGGYQLAELAFCMIVIPLVSIWLILPFDTFQNPAFRFMKIVPEEVWGLAGGGISGVWLCGVAGGRIRYRMLGSSLTVFFLLAIFTYMFLANPAALVNAFAFALAVIVGFLRIRQGWESGAGGT